MFGLNVKNENGRQSLKRMKKRSQVKKMVIKIGLRAAVYLCCFFVVVVLCSCCFFFLLLL